MREACISTVIFALLAAIILSIVSYLSYTCGLANTSSFWIKQVTDRGYAKFRVVDERTGKVEFIWCDTEDPVIRFPGDGEGR